MDFIQQTTAPPTPTGEPLSKIATSAVPDPSTIPNGERLNQTTTSPVSPSESSQPTPVPSLDPYTSAQERKLRFSLDRANIKNLLEKMIQVSESDKEVVNEPGVKAWVRNGTEFGPETSLVKARYTFKEDIDPARFMDLLTEKRKTWDKGILFYDTVHKEQDWTIYRYGLAAPVMFMKPMDFVEKRLIFEDNGTYYGYYTCVPDEVFPVDSKHSRCHTVFGGTVLRKEDSEYVYYSLSQVDPHVITHFFVCGLCRRGE